MKVPVLVDGETVLWDSCAICLYLLDQFDTDNILAPTEPAFRAKLYKVHLSDSHLSVANLGGDSKPYFRKEKITFWGNSGGTFLVADGP